MWCLTGTSCAQVPDRDNRYPEASRLQNTFVKEKISHSNDKAVYEGKRQ